ncbi:MAG: hypothetical protein VX638_10520 [Chloroflexota bacterium]|nr:hypothetical protein [Chloroflexota bacterium]
MTKTRFLALITALALLLAIPTSVFAQNARPHVFVGTVTLDGVAAADGAAVTAWIDGEQVGATTASAGKYVLQLESTSGFPGSTVSFKVSGADASQTIEWEQGGADEVDLTAATGSGSGGVVASAGATGPAGPAGMWGAKGDDGADGAAGPPGPAGSDGARGAPGVAGQNGSNGADGSNGSNGSNGAPGADGSDGGGGLGVIALIVAIVALLAAGGSYMMGRRA